MSKMLHSLAMKLIYHIIQYMSIFETKKILHLSWPIRADLHGSACETKNNLGQCRGLGSVSNYMYFP